MGIAAVEALKADLHDQPQNPLREYQVREYRDEMQQLASQVDGLDQDGRRAQDGDRGDAWLKGAKGGSIRQIRRIQKTLSDQAPKRVTGERADRIAAKVKEVGELIRDGMQPYAVMRRNPPGAVGQALRTEFNPAFKDAVLTLKRGLLALDPENSDPDYTNVERLRRPGVNPDGTSTFMGDAQIPGVFAMTPAAKRNWPFEEPQTTAVAEVLRREAAEPAVKAPKTATKRVPPPLQTYRCDHEGCDFERKGGFGKKAVEQHKAKTHVAPPAPSVE